MLGAEKGEKILQDDAHGGRKWMNRYLVYPFLFAVWPVLAFFAENYDEVLFADALVPLAVVLASAVGLYWIMRLLTRDRYKAGSIVLLWALCFFSYSVLHGLADAVNERLGIELTAGRHNSVRHTFFLPVYGVLSIVASLWLFLTRRKVGSLTGVLNVVSVFLVVVSLARMSVNELRYRMADPTNVSSGGAALTKDATGAVTGYPDIYYIVFDRYASNEVLLSAYDFDNADFRNYLKETGFFIAEKSRCNYASTTISLSSSLNMEYHPARVLFGPLVRGLRGGNKVEQFLHSRGYRYFHLGSWFMPTNSCRSADENLRLSFGGSEFERTLLKTTVLGPFMHPTGEPIWKPRGGHHEEHALFQFSKLEDLAETTGPKFVFAHILLPHGPFVFSRDGQPPPRRLANDKLRYLEQLQFLNEKIEHMINGVLAKAEIPPIIVIQGDEGPYVRMDDLKKTKREQYRIRTGILNAYYIPDLTANALYPTITPVNTFRIILSHVFGVELRLLDDRIYLWGDNVGMWRYNNEGAVEFVDVTDQIRE